MLVKGLVAYTHVYARRRLVVAVVIHLFTNFTYVAGTGNYACVRTVPTIGLLSTHCLLILKNDTIFNTYIQSYL